MLHAYYLRLLLISCSTSSSRIGESKGDNYSEEVDEDHFQIEQDNDESTADIDSWDESFPSTQTNGEGGESTSMMHKKKNSKKKNSKANMKDNRRPSSMAMIERNKRQDKTGEEELEEELEEDRDTIALAAISSQKLMIIVNKFILADSSKRFRKVLLLKSFTRWAKVSLQ